MLNVFLVHGFRSHCINMMSFYEAYKKNEIHFKTKVHPHNWRAGTVIESKFDTALEVLSKGFRGHADEVVEQWSEAADNIEESSKKLAEKINSSVPENGDVLLVGHSMGTEVVQHAIGEIREDIDIYLFLMGGIANALIFEDLIDHNDKVRLAYNYYSDSDRILKQFLPSIGIGFYDPIGINTMDSKKISNINTKGGHSDYFSSSSVLARYTELVTSLLNKSPGSYLHFT